MGLELTYPLMLLLLIPVGFVLYLFLRKNTGFSVKEKKIITVLRGFVFLLIIFSLTVPQIVWKTDEINVVFVVDTSASMKGTEDDIFKWMETSVKEKGEKDKFAVLTVGRNTGFEQSLTSGTEFIQDFTAPIDPYDTNLERGLQLAQSLFPANENGRIILFSDGNETSGDLIRAAYLLKQRGIVLDFVPIQGNVGPDMAITSFSVPSALYEGEEVQLYLEITSNYAQKAHVQILINEKELIREEIDVKEGTNSFIFSHRIEETGFIVYKAEITAEHDTFTENNTLSSISNVLGTPKVLIVQNNNDQRTVDILNESGLIVDAIIPEQLPSNLSSYIQYDTILFNNISATDVGENKMTLIEQAVKEFGTGFIMAGGEYSYGLGGYFKTPIEEILPVYMEIKGKEEIPSLGLIIVLDRSGSMQGEKLTLAKEAAARSVEMLRDKDTLGFIAFDDKPWEVIEAGPLENKEAALNQIRSVPAGGGTEIFSALQLAYERLTPLDLARKHIILLTDGQSDPNRAFDQLIEEGKKANITLSTVALGQDADRRLLSKLAELGVGRYYEVLDHSTIPSILSRETALVTRTFIVDDPFYPSYHGNPDWRALFNEGLPQMNAYIAVTPKERAEIVLSSEKEDPVLAEWQYGLGKTIAFTSDLTGEWTGDWVQWDRWPDVLNHLITKTLPTFNHEPFSVHVDTRDGQAVIQLTKDITQEVGPMDISVVSQTGEEIDSNVKMVAPGKYEVIMEQLPGVYFLSMTEVTKEGEKHYKTGFSIPYSEELLNTGHNFSLLQEASEITGGTELTSEQMAFAPLPVKSAKKQPISHWFLLIAFFLFFIEIAVKRFGLQFFLHAIPQVKMPKKTKQTATLQVDKLKKKIVNDKGGKTSSPKPAKSISKAPEIEDSSMNQNVGKTKSTMKKVTKNTKSPNSEVNRQDSIKRLLEAKNRTRKE